MIDLHQKEYYIEGNEILKEKIRKRDGFRCQMPGCHATKKSQKKDLFIHHIDYNKHNNLIDNLISLCSVCHSKTNYNRNYWLVRFQLLMKNKRRYKIFFTSDQHFYHKNVIKYCNRPFNSVEEMNEEIILRFNSVINNNDLCYFIGDVAFIHSVKETIMLLKKLNGFKILIVGSHDEVTKNVNGIFVKKTPLLQIKYNKNQITLCHYNMRVWPASHYNSIQLFGHSHGNLNPVGKQYDVGVDSNNFSPIHIDDVLKIIETYPNNFNFIKKDVE